MVAVGLALWVVRSTPALTVIALAFGVPAVVMTMLEAVLPGEDWVTLTSALLHAPFYFYVAYSTIRYLFHDDRVTTDELFAIGAAFTVVAWGFAYVYLAVVIIVPGLDRPAERRLGAVLRAAVLLVQQPDQRGTLRHPAGGEPCPVVGDPRAGRRRAVRRDGHLAPGRRSQPSAVSD